MRLIIATPFYEMKAWSPYVSSLVGSVLMLAKHTKVEVDFWSMAGCAYIDHARNAIANKFMASDNTHLLFIDSDMQWDMDGFARLLSDDVDIVGCGYPCKNAWDYFSCHIDTQEGYDPIKDSDGNVTHVGPPVVNEKGLIKASIVPTGLMKIKREVFERLAKEQPDNFYISKEGKIYNFFGRICENGTSYGEDVSFLRRWRSIGGECWVEPRITITHYGVKGWTGNYQEYLEGCPKPTKL